MALVDQAERDAASAIEDFAEEPAEPSAALVAAFAVPGFLPPFASPLLPSAVFLR